MLNNEPDGESTADSQQESDQQPADSEQSSAQSDEQPTEQTDQSTEQAEEQPAEGDQSTEQAEDQATDDDQSAGRSDTQTPEEAQQPAEQSGEKPTDESEQTIEQSDQSGDQTGEQAEAGSGGSKGAAGQPAAKGDLSAKRQSMLDLIDKWMPTSLNNPRKPQGETKDLLEKAGWTKATGQDNKKKKDAGEGFATGCGDVLHAMLVLWKSNFLGFFGIRDAAVGGPGAKARGFYVERDQLAIDGDVVKSPKPGDIIVLRNGVGKGATGVGHVGILVEARKDKWKTADGGGGSLPDQTAAVTERDVRWLDGVPIMKSVTDIKEKELDGWVDLDKLEQTG
jgi:hypothetical protein